MTTHDAEQTERCLAFWSALLRRGFDDLHGLCNGIPLPTGDGRVMTAAERAATLCEVQAWFFEISDSPVSLTAVCDHLNLSVGWMRGRARQIIAGSKQIVIRRRRLTTSQRAEICAMLRRGDSTTICAKRFGVEASTCRKTRIREMKNAAGISTSGAFRA